MIYTFNMDNIPIELNLIPSATQIVIFVHPLDGSVKVTAPPELSWIYINKLLAAKRDWIKINRETFLFRSNKTSPNPTTIKIWGNIYRLKIIEYKEIPQVMLYDDTKTVTIYVPLRYPIEKKEKLLNDWYCGLVKEAALKLLKKWELCIGVKVETLTVKNVKSYFGICRPKKKSISLNSKLIAFDPSYLEFILVHELVHLIDDGNGHKGNFYSLFAKYYPDWFIKDRFLNFKNENEYYIAPPANLKHRYFY